MMKASHTFFAFAFVSLITGMTSCSSEPKNPAELAQADSLIRELKKADSVLYSLNAEEVEERAEKIKAHQTSYRLLIPKLGDTLDYNTSMMLSDYEEAYKVFEEYGETRKKLRPSIDTLQQSLGNLSHDLRENSLAEGLDPKKCVADESKKVLGLSQYSGNIVPAVQHKIKMFDSLSPLVQKYIDDMNAKVNAGQSPKK